MTTNELKAIAVLKTPEALELAYQEALEKVASEIRQKMGGGTTAKAVQLLMVRHENIQKRVMEYTAAGVVGIALA